MENNSIVDLSQLYLRSYFSDMKPQYIILIVLSFLGLAWMLFFGQEEEFDTRAAIEDGISQITEKVDITEAEKNTLKVQLALADYIANNGQPPTSLNDLIPKYFSDVPIDANTGKQIFYAKQGLSFKLGLDAQEDLEGVRKLTDLALSLIHISEPTRPY